MGSSTIGTCSPFWLGPSQYHYTSTWESSAGVGKCNKVASKTEVWVAIKPFANLVVTTHDIH